MVEIDIKIYSQYYNNLYELINYFKNSTEKSNKVMKDLKYYIRDNSALVSGHIIDGKLISLIWCFRRHFGGKERIHISYFIVDEKYRGKGLSQDLLSFAKKMAYEREINQIDLNVSPDNYKAINLYQKAGFYTERLQLNMKLNEVDKNV